MGPPLTDSLAQDHPVEEAHGFLDPLVRREEHVLVLDRNDVVVADQAQGRNELRASPSRAPAA
jgi:hypothetical protein